MPAASVSAKVPAKSDRASAERCGPGGTLRGHEKRVAAIDLRSRADPERGNGDDGSGDGRFILAEDVAGDACWFLRVQDQGEQRKREERKRWNREQGASETRARHATSSRMSDVREEGEMRHCTQCVGAWRGRDGCRCDGDRVLPEFG